MVFFLLIKGKHIVEYYLEGISQRKKSYETTINSDIKFTRFKKTKITEGKVKVLEALRDKKRYVIDDVVEKSGLTRNVVMGIIPELTPLFVKRMRITQNERALYPKAQATHNISNLGLTLIDQINQAKNRGSDPVVAIFDPKNNTVRCEESEDSSTEDVSTYSSTDSESDSSQSEMTLKTKISDIFVDVLLELDYKKNRTVDSLAKATGHKEGSIAQRLKYSDIYVGKQEPIPARFFLTELGKRLVNYFKALMSVKLSPKLAVYIRSKDELIVEDLHWTPMRILWEIESHDASYEELELAIGKGRDEIFRSVHSLMGTNCVTTSKKKQGSHGHLVSILDKGKRVLFDYRARLSGGGISEGEFTIGEYAPDINEFSLTTAYIEALMALKNKEATIVSDVVGKVGEAYKVLNILSKNNYVEKTDTDRVAYKLTYRGEQLVDKLSQFSVPERSSPKIAVYNPCEETLVVMQKNEVPRPTLISILMQLEEAPLKTSNLGRRFNTYPRLHVWLARLAEEGCITRPTSSHGLNFITDQGRCILRDVQNSKKTVQEPYYLRQRRGEYWQRLKGSWPKLFRKADADSEVWIMRPLDETLVLKSHHHGVMIIKRFPNTINITCPSGRCVIIKPEMFALQQSTPRTLDMIWEIIMGYSPIHSREGVILLYLLRVCFVCEFRLTGVRHDGEEVHCMCIDEKRVPVCVEREKVYVFRDPLSDIRANFNTGCARVMFICHPRFEEIQSSHLCHKGEICIHPEHLTSESREENLARNDCPGDISCEHEPKCMLQGPHYHSH